MIIHFMLGSIVSLLTLKIYPDYKFFFCKSRDLVSNFAGMPNTLDLIILNGAF